MSKRSSLERTDSPPGDEKKPGEYVVVARRYRPQSFEELVGQPQVSQAMRNAIATNRVGHAYLFTGARGVGKTSTARIFAKALNCAQGPTATPCNECDICRSIASGEDVDVLEIDGASNRGIDEIRQLRSNVNIRPSRSRFKIYIIDEVHMLTPQAFNALLKTLEEPPEHVKFIFCTTDADKIPITVLSRCQRFDFSPVKSDAILDRLKHIVETEGVEADLEALQILARRAAGSMRDSQSLLEQLLSFCGERITADDVHAMLGTARGGALEKLASHIVERDAAAGLAEVNRALEEGVDVGQLTEQILGYFRDMMAAAVGCGDDLMLHTLPADQKQLRAAAQEMGLETILAVVQIFDQAVVRMRLSTHGRVLLEMAVVRASSLERLDELAPLLAQIKDGSPVTAGPRPAPRAAASAAPRAPDGEKKNGRDRESSAAPAREREIAAITVAPAPEVEPLSAENAGALWRAAVERLTGLTADFAKGGVGAATSGPNRLVVAFPENYNFQKQQCERPENKQKIDEAVRAVIGTPVAVTFETSLPVQTEAAAETPRRTVSRQQRMAELRSHPFVTEAIALFDAEILKAD